MGLLLLVIILGWAFDVINGFHDAANAIATIVTTRVLTPAQAVIWAAFFNFIAYLFFGLHVADTIAKGIVRTEFVTLPVILSGLVAAIAWNLVTWRLGIPSSSSHTLMGGFVGAAIAHAGWHAVIYSEVFKIIAFIVLAPLIGMIVSMIFSFTLLNLLKNSRPSKTHQLFRRLQLFSAAAYSLGHGTNDAQKNMGIIFVALISTKQLPANATIPLWVVLSCHGAMAIGTLLGGWRIVKTMGSRITHLTPFEGFSAETAGAITLFGTSALGIPVSTTHTIAGAIMGAGITKRLSAVRWGVSTNMVASWIITIPITAVVACGIQWISQFV
ncbi:inorganic phosphate transporter [Deminuibacter soli]|uniref:Inorganic phosphate transporter n=2 Tax=Deminuibacter soli TaxID=2291815 RepID=A0A3E1NG42_9BACT|nr:inorganic phosphate transporter [Deminuibacter soli]